MKIAIVGPSPVPFVIGGIENMLRGLYEQINQHTPHQAEIIKLPSKEHTFWDLIDDYYQFYKLDLRHFDAVIVTKYPAWMVQNDHKIFYVAHRLRGLYDTYHLMHQPLDVPRGNAKIDKLLTYMDANPMPGQLDTFFSLVFELKNKAGAEEQPFFSFPGPLIRKLVHYMDDFAFNAHLPGKFYTISQTVKDRKEYFPADSSVDVVYLPSGVDHSREGDYNHIFMISRLDAPKRIDMLVKAMKHVKSDVKLFIAGTGPEKEKLEKLAKGDERIHFLGFVLDEYYANSLVIPYFPQQEDYGLITVEAMMHAKPVITTKDSGGPTEFVRDFETGFVVECSPRAIAEKIDYLAQHRDEACRMGKAAQKIVQQITWDNVTNILLSDDTSGESRKRKKITVTSNFPIYPPQGGGQARIFNVYRELAKYHDVEIVSLTACDQKGFDQYLCKGLREIRIPRTEAHQQKIANLEIKAKLPLTDIAELRLASETPAYCEALKRSIESSDFVIFSHPYLYPLGRKYLNGKPFAYEAHNLEYLMKKEMLPDTAVKKELLEWVYQAEKECCQKARFITACSEEDQQRLSEIYGVPLEKIIVVPNGVNTDEVLFTPVEQRLENKKQLGLENEKIAIFMGSWHGPNLEACEAIFKIAEICPRVKFLIMGSQCGYFKKRKLPANVALMGLVSEQTKTRVFEVADCALNPMYSGSGTNLKMFDYMAGGLPVISTEFGTRGIKDKTHFILANTVEEFGRAINAFELEDQASRVEKARKYVRDTFDWKVIVEKWCLEAAL